MSGNPWVIDTAGASALTAERMRLARVRWIGATTLAHTAVITDSVGKVKWASEASGGSYAEADAADPNCDGLVVPTLGSGKLYIYFK